jgi:hypothetical protein
MIHRGACHCGAVRLSFATERPLAPRACMCSFCRKHGARTVSDPGGCATIEASVPPILYRFGSRATDYVLCARCGIYVGAVFGPPEARIATLNLNAFDDPHLGLEASPVSYDGESDEAKAKRRRERWTPLRSA